MNAASVTTAFRPALAGPYGLPAVTEVRIDGRVVGDVLDLGDGTYNPAPYVTVSTIAEAVAYVVARARRVEGAES